MVGLFYTASGSETEFTDFEVDAVSEPARLFLPTGGAWPTADAVPAAVRVRFRAGYVTGDSPTDDVPSKIQAAIMLYVRAYFDAGEDADKWRASAENLLRPYRVERGMA